MYFLSAVVRILSGNCRPSHSFVTQTMASVPDIGVLEVGRQNTKGFPSCVNRSCSTTRRSNPALASGGMTIGTNLCFTDFPSTITISILKLKKTKSCGLENRRLAEFTVVC